MRSAGRDSLRRPGDALPSRLGRSQRRPAQDGPGEPKRHPRAANRSPGSRQRPPGEAPEAQKHVKHTVFTTFYVMPKEPPRAPQEVPRSCPEVPKTPPGLAQRGPKRPQGFQNPRKKYENAPTESEIHGKNYGNAPKDFP